MSHYKLVPVEKTVRGGDILGKFRGQDPANNTNKAKGTGRHQNDFRAWCTGPPDSVDIGQEQEQVSTLA